MTHHSLLQISTTRVYWEPLLKEGKGWYNARLSLLRLSDGAWGMGDGGGHYFKVSGGILRF